MGTKQKRLFLWAGIFAAISAGVGFVSLITLNFFAKSFYSQLLNYLQYDVGLTSTFEDFKTYFNFELLVMGAVNLFLAMKYIGYSKMTIRQLTTKGSNMLFILLLNAFCGGNTISLILAIIGMVKPITPDFSEKSIKEIDRELLDRNPNTISRIIRVKQDKLNGLITEEEYINALNKILEDEARRFL